MLWLIAIFTYFTAASHLTRKHRREAKKPSLYVRSLVRLLAGEKSLRGECGRGMRPSAGVEFIPCVQLNAPLH